MDVTKVHIIICTILLLILSTASHAKHCASYADMNNTINKLSEMSKYIANNQLIHDKKLIYLENRDKLLDGCLSTIATSVKGKSGKEVVKKYVLFAVEQNVSSDERISNGLAIIFHIKPELVDKEIRKLPHKIASLIVASLYFGNLNAEFNNKITSDRLLSKRITALCADFSANCPSPAATN
jgi:hypothetical protein